MKKAAQAAVERVKARIKIIMVTIPYHDFVTARSPDALLADRFEQAGIPLRPMLWTAWPWDFTIEERTEMWKEELARAGVLSMKKWHNEDDQMIEIDFEVKA